MIGIFNTRTGPWAATGMDKQLDAWASIERQRRQQELQCRQLKSRSIIQSMTKWFKLVLNMVVMVKWFRQAKTQKICILTCGLSTAREWRKTMSIRRRVERATHPPKSRPSMAIMSNVVALWSNWSKQEPRTNKTMKKMLATARKWVARKWVIWTCGKYVVRPTRNVSMHRSMVV